jgi:hypothetical protein
MFFIEHRKGRSPVKRETNASHNIEQVLAAAKRSAANLGADNFVILNRAGRVTGVFSTYSSDID